MRERSLKILTRARLAIVFAAFAAGVVVIGVALAAPAVPTPTILTHPSDPTNSTSASFTYGDTQAGVTYRCQVDGDGYVACPASGVSYAGPLAQGNHTFTVQAVSGTKNSTAASFTWLVDLTTPVPTMTFPAEGGLYTASAYKEGCAAGPGICGKAKDVHGVASVAVSVQRVGGNWWGGSSFNKTSETFNAATLDSPGSNAPEWRYPLGLPADGAYIVAGNITPAGSQAAASFTIDTTAPPTPTIASGPEAETTSKSATFTFTDTEAGVSFLCAKDERVYYACTSPKTYEPNNLGEHNFTVEARDAAGNVSGLASYTWTVIKGMTIEGGLAGQLAPGVTRPFALVLNNPESKAVVLTSLKVTANELSSKAGCTAPANLEILQSNVSEANTVTIPARGKITLPSGSVTAPQVLMKNLATNQDACKGAAFTFNYTDSGHA
jgi:hypothetical protein